MPPTSPAPPSLEALQQNRQRVAEIRERARRLLQQGATGVQVTAAISEATIAFLRESYQALLASLPEADRAAIAADSCVIGVGGTGRGDLCPWSDVDLLFLYSDRAAKPFKEIVG